MSGVGFFDRVSNIMLPYLRRLNWDIDSCKCVLKWLYGSTGSKCQVLALFAFLCSAIWTTVRLYSGTPLIAIVQSRN